MAEKILIVENDEKFIEQLIPKIEAAQFQTGLAMTSAEALEQLKAEPFTLAIIDLAQPEIEGEALVGQMEADPELKKIPVLALCMNQHLDKITSSSVVADYFLKPVLDIGELVSRVKWISLKSKEKADLVAAAEAAPKAVIKKRVLIVDDNEDVIETFRIRLEAEGFLTQVAKDGEEAINVISVQKPDLILLDVMMPKMDGFSTLKQLNQITERKVPVIIITGTNAVPEDEFRIEGVSAFMRKPIDGNVLSAQIKSILN